MDVRNVLTVWGGGQLLAFSGIDGKTDYQNGLVCRTAFTHYGLDIKLPGQGRLVFSERKPERVSISGDFFCLEFPDCEVTGAFVDTYHLLVEGPCRVDSPDMKWALRAGKTLIGVPEYFDASLLDLDVDSVTAERAAWLTDIKPPQELSPSLSQAFYRALAQLKTQIYTPEGNLRHVWSTPDRWPHRDMWLWDSVFHAIAIRHIDGSLARDVLEAVLDIQEQDGFVAHQANPEGHSEITQPPVLAFGVKLVNDIAADWEWVRRIYPALKAYLAWDMEHRDTDGNGLLEWFIEGDERCRSGESGMDNSPRFDMATQLDAVDFNSFMALEYKTLSEFAERLGYEEDAREFQQKYETLCALINQFLWNETTGFYHDYDPACGERSGILASSGFLPLLCGACSPEQAAKLVGHLANPKTFATPFPIPSIAVSSQSSYSKDMWRGPVWTNINWLVAYGLRNYGYVAEAETLLSGTVAEQAKMYQRYGSFFEFYDDRCEVDPPELLRKGQCAPEKSPFHQVLFDFGWSATLFIDMIYSGCRSLA